MKDVLGRMPRKSVLGGALKSRRFSDLVRERMQVLGVNVVSVAADCRVATNTIHRVLRGQTEPSGSLVAKLLVLLDIQAADLRGVRVNPREESCILK